MPTCGNTVGAKISFLLDCSDTIKYNDDELVSAAEVLSTVAVVIIDDVDSTSKHVLPCFSTPTRSGGLYKLGSKSRCVSWSYSVTVSTNPSAFN